MVEDKVGGFLKRRQIGRQAVQGCGAAMHIGLSSLTVPRGGLRETLSEEALAKYVDTEARRSKKRYLGGLGSDSPVGILWYELKCSILPRRHVV